MVLCYSSNRKLTLRVITDCGQSYERKKHLDDITTGEGLSEERMKVDQPKEEHSRQRERQVQRPRGGNMMKIKHRPVRLDISEGWRVRLESDHTRPIRPWQRVWILDYKKREALEGFQPGER